ncbi:MAG: universal stress protein, partial [Methanobrevibacter sp.]|nr:universal stress protein [Methanobrevibacter sp.]
IEVTEHLLTADPLRDMKFIVDQTRADLVVIHAHGANNNRFVSFDENNVSDTQIGSVSERLLRTSDVPVLLIK